ncbi:MAG TPA: preprotein translocase subunit SecG [Gemmatimonadaceae bacterium]|nr:preprotein translocase subunit SecG [Gemmatimonadaceae bacterium]
MYTFLLILLILDSLILIAGILMQAAKGGGLAATFGGVSTAADSLIGTRQAGHFLSKLTWWCGGIFLGLAFVMQLMSTRAAAPSSILDRLPGQTQGAPSSPQTAPPQSAVPLTPAEKAPPAGGQKKDS